MVPEVVRSTLKVGLGGVLLLMLTAGCIHKVPTLNERLAEHLSMSPFGMDGGYELGSVVTIDNNGRLRKLPRQGDSGKGEFLASSWAR